VRRSERRSAIRGAWCLAAGVAVLLAAWLGPLPELARRAFSAHMAMHVSVVAVAAPLLAVGLARAFDGRLDPARRLPRLFSPVPASALELVVVWGWHAPALHHAARSGAGMLTIEQASFLLSGLLVWLSAFGGPIAPEERRNRSASGIVGMLLTSMHMTLLGALLALAGRPLYPRHSQPGEAGWLGLGVLQDQQLGGALMLLGGGTVYLAGGLVLAYGLLRERGAGVDRAGRPA
jgi:putative membrane protein